MENEVTKNVISVREKAYQRMLSQLSLLMDWNEDNINIDPEQARKNLKTIFNIIPYLDYLGNPNSGECHKPL